VLAEPRHLVSQLLRESRAGREFGTVPDELRQHWPAAGPRFSLPEPAEDGFEIADVLARRRAARQFAMTAIPLDAVSAILASAMRADAADWPAESAAGIELTCFLLAWRVDTLPAAIYRYATAGHELITHARIPAAPAAQLLRQPEFGQAAAFIEVVGNLAAAVESQGSHGYRQLLVRAGAAGHRAWLAAVAAGLSGCVFEGLLPLRFKQAVGTDGFTAVRLVATAIGESS